MPEFRNNGHIILNPDAHFIFALSERNGQFECGIGVVVCGGVCAAKMTRFYFRLVRKCLALCLTWLHHSHTLWPFYGLDNTQNYLQENGVHPKPDISSKRGVFSHWLGKKVLIFHVWFWNFLRISLSKSIHHDSFLLINFSVK